MTTPDGYTWEPLARERREAELETIRSGYRTPEEQARDDYEPELTRHNNNDH